MGEYRRLTFVDFWLAHSIDGFFYGCVLVGILFVFSHRAYDRFRYQLLFVFFLLFFWNGLRFSNDVCRR